MLASRIESAYWGAYWNGASKHKKSPKTVIKSLYKDFERKKNKPKPIDLQAVEKEFAEMEALRKYGRIEK